MQNCNFACYFVWVCSLVPHVAGGTYAEGVREQGAEKDIWVSEDEITGEWRTQRAAL